LNGFSVAKDGLTEVVKVNSDFYVYLDIEVYLRPKQAGLGILNCSSRQARSWTKLSWYDFLLPRQILGINEVATNEPPSINGRNVKHIDKL
jgi:hypothetical protein